MENGGKLELAGLFVAAIVGLAGAVGVMYKQLVTSGERRMADLQDAHTREMAAKDRVIADKDQEIERLNNIIRQLRERGGHARPPSGGSGEEESTGG